MAKKMNPGLRSIYCSDKELWEKAQKKAAQYGLSMSAYIQMLLRKDVNRLEDGEYRQAV